jgi:hypothetical protein
LSFINNPPKLSMEIPVTPHQGSAKKRRRPPRACTQCRRRKMRCDQNEPCSNCARSHGFECIYPAQKRPIVTGSIPEGSGTQQTVTLAPRSTHQLNSGTLTAPSTSSSLRVLAQSPLSQPRPFQMTSHTPSVPVHSSQITTLLDRVGELERKISSNTTPKDISQDVLGNSSSFTAKPRPESIGERRFASQSSWINGTSLVCN